MIGDTWQAPQEPLDVHLVAVGMISGIAIDPGTSVETVIEMLANIRQLRF